MTASSPVALPDVLRMAADSLSAVGAPTTTAHLRLLRQEVRCGLPNPRAELGGSVDLLLSLCEVRGVPDDASCSLLLHEAGWRDAEGEWMTVGHHACPLPIHPAAPFTLLVSMLPRLALAVGLAAHAPEVQAIAVTLADGQRFVAQVDAAGMALLCVPTNRVETGAPDAQVEVLGADGAVLDASPARIDPAPPPNLPALGACAVSL